MSPVWSPSWMVVFLLQRGLCNSMKLWAIPFMGNSDKMWFTGGGNGKPLQYSCLKNPTNSMKYICVCVYIYIHISDFIYSPVPLCEFAYSLKFICNPQVNRRSTFGAIWGHGQRGKKIWVTHGHVPSWGQIRWCCFMLLTRILFHLTFLRFFFFFGGGRWWFCCFK